MAIRCIGSAADHEAALRQIEQLWGADEGSDDGNLLEALVIAVEAYESENCATDATGSSRDGRSADGGSIELPQNCIRRPG